MLMVRRLGLTLLIAVAGCQPQREVGGPAGQFDGVYHGVRRLVSGACDPNPTALIIRIRDSHYQARDGGMVFDVDRTGDLGGFGLYQASGTIKNDHMNITLRGAPPRGCTYEFDMRLSPGQHAMPVPAVPTPRFDGHWVADDDGWSLTADVRDGRIDGQILRCLNVNTQTWSGAGPAFLGTIDPSGNVQAETTDNTPSWTHRAITGALPALSVRAELATQLNCPDKQVTFVRQ